MTSASFTAEIPADAPRRFAELSGDWNPLHTDAAYAAGTAYRNPVLHGAYAAGLLSRLAGMHLPGRECLLHGMRLRFVAPVVPPVSVVVSGKIVSGREEEGTVEVTISDAASGLRYVEGSYDFGLHEAVEPGSADARPAPEPESGSTSDPIVLVTGATGAIGSSLLARLGDRGRGTSRRPTPGLLHVESLDRIDEVIGDQPLDAVVHCAWPQPDNTALTLLQDLAGPIDHHVAGPLRQVMSLARLLRSNGTPDAALVLIGSTAASPGRHNYRMPLYSLGKSMLPALARILALELGPTGRRCVSVEFDVVEDGMNAGLSRAARLAHSNRSPTGLLPDASEAAEQLAWVLDNRSHLVSGANISLSGGAIP